MQFSAATVELAYLIVLFGTASAYRSNPSVGIPTCSRIGATDLALNDIDCTNSFFLGYCNQMCNYQGNNQNFWPSQ